MLQRLRDGTAGQAERDMIHAAMQKLLCRTYKESEKRCLATVSLFYLDDRPMTARAIGRKCHIAVRTVYKDLDTAIPRLAAVIYEVPGASQMASPHANNTLKGVEAYRYAVKQLLERVRGGIARQGETEMLLSVLQKLHYRIHKEEEKRRLAVIALYYLSERTMTIKEISRYLNIAPRTVFKYIDAAINCLTIAIYGIYGIGWQN